MDACHSTTQVERYVEPYRTLSPHYHTSRNTASVKAAFLSHIDYYAGYAKHPMRSRLQVYDLWLREVGWPLALLDRQIR